MDSLLSDNQLVYLKEQSPANPRNFFNFKGTLMSFKEGTTLGRREWICDNTILAFGKLVMECDNHRSPGLVNRVVVVDPQYTAKLAMEGGNTRNRALVNMMAQHKTPSTRQYFFPTNGDKTHWFLIVADIKNGKITGMETLKTNRMGALIKVKKILNDNWDALGNGPKPVWKLKMKMPPTMPLQKDSVNCGIYTCAFMDLIAAGVTYSALKSLVFNRNINYIRGRFTRFMDGFNYA
jgi:Ulp1 family protease